MAELHLYDFDGTLFRSPDPPDWYDRSVGSWWISHSSLDEPCVPHQPGGEWWVGNTVTAAKASISDPNVFAICCTGRTEKPFRWRVPELLKQRGLNFDAVYLNPGMDTAAFKRGILSKLLNRYPFVEHVVVWEDDATKAASYVKHVKSLGRTIEFKRVNVTSPPAMCGPDAQALFGRVAARWLDQQG